MRDYEGVNWLFVLEENDGGYPLRGMQGRSRNFKLSNNTWLFQFRQPGFHELSSLRDILSNLDAHEDLPTSVISPSFEGALNKVMAILEDHLLGDYATNILEKETVPWNFDCVVTDTVREPGAIGILTRLSSREDSKIGSSLYGPYVKRIGVDHYRVWL